MCANINVSALASGKMYAHTGEECLTGNDTHALFILETGSDFHVLFDSYLSEPMAYTFFGAGFITNPSFL